MLTEAKEKAQDARCGSNRWCALLLAFEHSGGVPLRVVFDNPKMVVVGREDGGRPMGLP